MMCFVGQYVVFKDAESVLKSLKGVEINAKQIERVCHHYGGLIEKQDEQMLKSQIYHSYEPEQSNQLHYAMVDGAMYLTREEKWKEAKLGRIFKADDNFEISENKRSIITNSTYAAQCASK